MNTLRIRIRDNKTAFAPDEVIEGNADWTLDKAVTALELRLFWHTQGKGDADVSVEASRRIEAPPLSGGESFRFTLPTAPYSFSGTLISLSWALELVVVPGEDATQQEFVLAPSGKEVLLVSEAGAQPQIKQSFAKWINRKNTSHSTGGALEQRSPFDN